MTACAALEGVRCALYDTLPEYAELFTPHKCELCCVTSCYKLITSDREVQARRPFEKIQRCRDNRLTMGKGDDVRAADDKGAASLDCFHCARPSDNVDSHGLTQPVSPKSPMSLPASMELSPKSSMSPLPAAMELEIVTETATTAELLERDAAQRDAEAPGECGCG